MYWRGQKRVFIIRNKKQHLWAAAPERQPWPWVFPLRSWEQAAHHQELLWLSENSMIKPFLLKCGQLFESLYTACSCIDLTKSGLAIWGFSKENTQYASVERLLLRLLPQFSFSFRSMAQHRPTVLGPGQSNPAALQQGAGARSCGWRRVLLPAAAASALQHLQELLHTCWFPSKISINLSCQSQDDWDVNSDII